VLIGNVQIKFGLIGISCLSFFLSSR